MHAVAQQPAPMLSGQWQGQRPQQHGFVLHGTWQQALSGTQGTHLLPQASAACPPEAASSVPTPPMGTVRPLPVLPLRKEVFSLTLQLPRDLLRLGDCRELAPPRHGEALVQSLPVFPTTTPPAPPTHVDLATALGFTEVQIADLGHRWVPLVDECLEEPDEDLLHDAGTVASTESVTRLDITASRWEAKVREQEEHRRRYDWSFERKLYKPSLAMLEALQHEEEMRLRCDEEPE